MITPGPAGASLMDPGKPLILVTGATGYIGGRLVPRLLAAGHRVRCLARNPERLAGRPWPGVEKVQGDVSDPEALAAALRGVAQAYYLVHAMGEDRPDFRGRDLRQATTFAEACARAGVRRIIYLGGLGDPTRHRSDHLASRQEVGAALGSSGVPVLEFRAAVIVGSGSASFEMLRHLTERLPFMITPRWVKTRCQPIGVRDVLAYLTEALEHPDLSGIYEVGGGDVLDYRDMMLAYAQARGLRRVILPMRVPFPILSAIWVELVTPLPMALAKPLVEGMTTEVVVRDPRALEAFRVRPMVYREALELALRRLDEDAVETTWASSLAGEPEGRALGAYEGMLLERHALHVRARPGTIFQAFCALGGESGWPAGNWLWQLRGTLDRALGGKGMRRGRRHPRELRVGDPVDFWRVEALEPDRLLRLRSEMKLDGHAWLQFTVRPEGTGSRLEQTAFFEPHGLLGLLYWYAVLPFHWFVFPGLIRALKRRAEASVTESRRGR
ncbi:NAD(P)-dependent oxidoreductase [Geothrix limicola]|uniref:NAD(P)-dependent oxidoreductase n=1 Tax=Geothrix limicola TaxID=2927978 RepID=A0ABQ5QGT9_9BACT|nr:SDR family oxidoreductase [Geothrix limicola]GLH74080.1 NAD(P)-dependent oxidoreductase [Geothrix limicola]